MKVQRVETSGELMTNTYIINEDTIIDPGEGIGKYIPKDKEVVVLLTHAHYDHILGLSELNVKQLYVHPLDVEILKDPIKNFSYYVKKPFSWNNGWEDITETFEVIHTPGHTPGSCVIHLENYLFTGDTLFYDSIGRVDLEGGSFQDMKKSLKILKDYLLTLPKDTIIAPGHMALGKISDVMEFNSYLK